MSTSKTALKPDENLYVETATHWQRQWPQRQTSHLMPVAGDPGGGGEPPRTPPKTSELPPDKSGRDRLTTKEAAYYLRLSARTLERYRVEGTGPHYLRAGRSKKARIFYLRADLDAWIEDRRFLSTAEYGR